MHFERNLFTWSFEGDKMKDLMVSNLALSLVVFRSDGATSVAVKRLKVTRSLLKIDFVQQRGAPAARRGGG